MLRRLVGVPVEEFAARYWGRRPLICTAAELPQSFTDLFGNDAVDTLVSRCGLRAPFLRVARNGTTLGDSAFTSGGGVGAAIADQVDDAKLLRLFADGATIVLQGLHRTWPALIDFTQQLAADLGHPVQVNAYVTPPQNTGFSDHYDVHDVFVLQVEGEKQWRVREPVHPAPLRDQPWTAKRAAVEEAARRPPLLELTMHPGDCLYLPRGYLHSATALGGVSTHLTVGVHTWTRHLLAEQLVQAALPALAEDAELRTSLPLGADVGEFAAIADDVERVRAALIQALEDVDAAALTDGLARRARDAQRPAPIAPLAQLRAANHLDGIRRVGLRGHLAPRLSDHGTYAVLHSRAGEFRLQPADLPRVRQLLAGGVADVQELGDDLARRLLLAGLAVPADA